MDVAVSLVTRVVLFGVTAATGILIARWLRPEGRGLLSICITIPSLIAAAVGFAPATGVPPRPGARTLGATSAGPTAVAAVVDLGIARR